MPLSCHQRSSCVKGSRQVFLSRPPLAASVECSSGRGSRAAGGGCVGPAAGASPRPPACPRRACGAASRRQGATTYTARSRLRWSGTNRVIGQTVLGRMATVTYNNSTQHKACATRPGHTESPRKLPRPLAGSGGRRAGRRRHTRTRGRPPGQGGGAARERGGREGRPAAKREEGRRETQDSRGIASGCRLHVASALRQSIISGTDVTRTPWSSVQRTPASYGRGCSPVLAVRGRRERESERARARASRADFDGVMYVWCRCSAFTPHGIVRAWRVPTPSPRPPACPHTTIPQRPRRAAGPDTHVRAPGGDLRRSRLRRRPAPARSPPRALAAVRPTF